MFEARTKTNCGLLSHLHIVFFLLLYNTVYVNRSTEMQTLGFIVFALFFIFIL